MTNQVFIAFIKKNPISIGCGLLAVGLSVGAYFRADAIPEADTVLTDKSAVSEKYALNIKNSAQLKDQLEDLTAAIKAIDGHIIRASQLGTNTQFFYKLRSDTGVTMVDFQQTTPSNVAKPAKGTFLPVAFRVTVQGNVTQLLEYLRALESGAHYARVLTANLTGNPVNRNAPLTLALTLELLGTP